MDIDISSKLNDENSSSSNDFDSRECRVCRSNSEDGRPLFTPCLCSGSIGLVHQDCLEAWLSHSKKEACELCSSKYVFLSHYAEDAPTILPIFLFIKSLIKLVAFSWLPFLARLILAVLIWLIAIPVGSTCIYCMCLHRKNILFYGGIHSKEELQLNVTTGIVLDAVIALSLLVLMSFTDFMRFNWGPVAQPPQQQQQQLQPHMPVPPNNHRPAAPQQQPPLQQRQQQRPQYLGRTAERQMPSERNIMRSPRYNQQVRRRRTMKSAINQRQEQSRRDSTVPEVVKKSSEDSHNNNDSPRHYFKRNHGSVLYSSDSREFYYGNMSPVRKPRNFDGSLAPARTPFPDDSAAAASAANIDRLSSVFEFKADSLETKHSQRYLQRAKSISSNNSRFFTGANDGASMDEQEYSFITDKDSSDYLSPPAQEEFSNVLPSEQSAADSYVSRQSGVGLASKVSADDELSEYETDEDDMAMYKKQESLSSSDEDEDEDEKYNDADEFEDNNGDYYDSGSYRMYGAPERNEVDNHQHDGMPPPEPLAPPVLPMPPQQQQEQQQQNANNGFGFNFDDFGNDNIDMEAQEVGLEVRVALFDLLGLEGSLHIMFRNAVWLLGFVTLFMLTLFSLPYLIGMSVSTRFDELYARHAFISYISDALVSLKTREIYRLVQEFSSKYENPIHFFDITVMGIGFCTIFTVVFMLNFVLQALYSYMPRARFAITSISEVMSRLSIIVKVGLLLVIRIFILPVLLGSLILLYCADVLFQFSPVDWANFLAVNCIGAYALAWVTGITFMLIMTISVLQLREVLHPEIFGKLIRPQEAHIDLITSLINENAGLHVRRIVISMVVYILLMTLLLYLPILVARNLLIWCAAHSSIVDYFVKIGVLKFELRLWYFVPEIQLPLEILLSHVTFLSILDKRKDCIGWLQHVWFVHACKFLGLTRYLLPLPRIKLRRRVDVLHDANTEIDVDNNIQVGDPLPRPPPGWDIRTPNSSTRWAWGNEEPSQLERLVAPRLAPSYCMLRCAVLICVTWCLLACITVSLTLLPVVLGRIAHLVTQLVPMSLAHDPACYVIGLMVLAPLIELVVVMGNRVVVQAAQRVQQQQQQQPREQDVVDLQQNDAAIVLMPTSLSIWRNVSEGVASIAEIPIGVLVKLIFVAVVWVADELAVGTMLSYSISDMLPSENCSSEFFQNSSWFLLWVRGMILVDTTVVLLLSNTIGPVIARTLGGDRLAQWAQTAKVDMAILFALPGLLLHFCRILVSFTPTQLLNILLAVVGSIESDAHTQDILMQLSEYWRHLYDKIRDDNFLIGRTLQNASRKVQ
eukprot:gene22078-30313_t